MRYRVWKGVSKWRWELDYDEKRLWPWSAKSEKAARKAARDKIDELLEADRAGERQQAAEWETYP